MNIIISTQILTDEGKLKWTIVNVPILSSRVEIQVTSVVTECYT